MKLLDLKYKFIIFLFLIGLISCGIPKNIMQQEKIITLSTKAVISDTVKTYVGWWVYGEGQSSMLSTSFEQVFWIFYLQDQMLL